MVPGVEHEKAEQPTTDVLHTTTIRHSHSTVTHSHYAHRATEFVHNTERLTVSQPPTDSPIESNNL